MSDKEPLIETDRLREIPFFKGLTPFHIEELKSISIVEEKKDGETIFAEGDIGDTIHFILGGEVDEKSSARAQVIAGQITPALLWPVRDSQGAGEHGVEESEALVILRHMCQDHECRVVQFPDQLSLTPIGLDDQDLPLITH